MIYFLNITLQSKSPEDWSASLDWADSDTYTRYQLRGYGSTPGEAADDAWKRYNTDRDRFIEHKRLW